MHGLRVSNQAHDPDCVCSMINSLIQAMCSRFSFFCTALSLVGAGEGNAVGNAVGDPVGPVGKPVGEIVG